MNVAILEPGESITSDRILQDCGPGITSWLHFCADRQKEAGVEPPDYLKPIWKDYLKFHLSRPAKTRHQKLHASHATFLDPEEARFVTADLIKTLCVVGQPAEVVEELRVLEKKGVNEILLNFPLARSYRMLEEFSRDIIEKY